MGGHTIKRLASRRGQVALACAVLIVVYLLQAHDFHAALDHLPPQPTHSVTTTVTSDVSRLMAQHVERHAEVVCPLPGLDVPRVTSQHSLAVFGATLLVVLALASHKSGVGRIIAVLPRPPGPDRQALLQRFTL